MHLAWEGYRDLASATSKIASGCDVDVEDNASYSSEGSKRKQPESVVTLQQGSVAKKGRGGLTAIELPVAGWIRGEAEITASGDRAVEEAGCVPPPVAAHGDREEGGEDRPPDIAALGELAADANGSGKRKR